MTTTKKNILKQVLSILLCICMVLGMMPVPSFTYPNINTETIRISE